MSAYVFTVQASLFSGPPLAMPYYIVVFNPPGGTNIIHCQPQGGNVANAKQGSPLSGLPSAVDSNGFRWFQAEFVPMPVNRNQPMQLTTPILSYNDGPAIAVGAISHPTAPAPAAPPPATK